MGKVMISGVAPQMTVPVSYKANFADNTWEQIIDACQKNAVPETWLVGDQKNMNINGTSYAIDIIGKNHDTYSDGSGTAPLTFQMHDSYATNYHMNSSNTNADGWESCAMRTTHLPFILGLMPSEVQSGIKGVNKLTSAGRQSSIINTTSDKLFLLSEVEIFGSTPYSESGEGSQYAYYKAGNSKVKMINDSALTYWERSPYGGDRTSFCCVNNVGDAVYNSASGSHGVSFAFCF